MRVAPLFACPLLLITCFTASGASDPSFKVPDGFEITQYAGDDLAHDIFSLTIDSHGRVVVAGKDYVKILHDTTGRGVADKATIFSTVPHSGAHGMVFDGDDLICTGDNAVLRISEGKPPLVLRSDMKGHSEHGTNGIVKGPDGWYYVIGGNDSGIRDVHATGPGSPVKKPQQGALARFSPDFTVSEVIAHGFRNPYDFDFTATGQLFTVDSDGERVHHLPWYAPTRLFDIAIGGHHGWMLSGWQRSWSRPPYFTDNVSRSYEIGRGSPTGVVTYRHRQFPERYRGGVFSVCWTFGSIYFFPLTPSGSSFDAKIETFMQTTGNVGFAPVDIAVGPDGDMFVAIGGRGTRGSVYRIRYTGQPPVPPITGDELHQVLAADQPLASWSRAKWAPLARKLGPKPFEAAAADEQLPALERIRAVEVLVELHCGVSHDLATRLSKSPEPLIVAHTAWALSRRALTRDDQQLLADLTYHKDPVVQRAAWEAIIALPDLPATLERKPDFLTAMSSTDRRVRWAAITAARGPGRGSFMAIEDPRLTDGNPRLDLANLWFEGIDHNNPEWTSIYFHVCANAYNETRDPALRLEAVRLMQIGLGDIRTTGGADEGDTGYTANEYDKVNPDLREDIARVVAPAFPSGNRELDFELARLLAMLHADQPHLLDAVTSRWTESSSPDDDLHFLLVMAQLPGAAARSPEVTQRTAHALASLHAKMEQRHWLADRLWPATAAAVFAKITKLNADLPAALVADAAFGRPEHTAFAEQMTGDTKLAAARKLLAAAQAAKSPDAFTPELISLLSTTLPPEVSLPIVRPLAQDTRLKDAVALALARHADPADRAALLASLQSPSSAVVLKVADGLAKLPPGSPDEVAAIIRSLGRHEVSRPTALALSNLLAKWTAAPKTEPTFRAWMTWFAAQYPEQARALTPARSIDTAAFLKHLPTIDWSHGDAPRGRLLFEQRLCSSCHEGQRKLGPDLANIAGRFSRDDLFANIVDPNLSISPSYRALQITTKDGAVHIGVPVYESPESYILETAPGLTVRLTADQIAATEPARRSPMPEGLLTGLTDQDLADFYAYLQTLK